jgi:hypothetical protein
MKFTAEHFDFTCKGKNKKIFWIKHPKFGSGKIHRRIYLHGFLLSRPNSHRSTREEKINLLDNPKHPINESKFVYPNQSVKIIYGYWNRVGFPFIKHRPIKSKTNSRIFSLLVPICKKYEQRKIVEAIDVGYKIFCNTNFAFHRYYNRNKIGLNDFLDQTMQEYKLIDSTPAMKTIAKRHGILFPKSWFAECVHGFDYMTKKYIINYMIDDNPEITKKLIKIVQEHQNRRLNETGLSYMIQFSKMFINFAELNKFDILWLIDRFNDALNKFHTVHISKTRYLISKSFFEEILPHELIRYDKMLSRHDFITNWKELLK